MSNFKIIKNKKWKEVDYNSILKKLPNDWNYQEIGYLINPNNKSKIKAGDSTSFGKYPFFNCSEIQKKYFNDFQIDGENLFITTGGDYLFTLYYNGKASYSTDVWSIKIKDAYPKFIHYFLKSNFQVNQNYFRGFKFKHLDKEGFKKMVVSIPPLSQQSSIASILSAQESIIQDIESLISKYETRLRYLSEELLSGRLRIKEVDDKTVFYKNTEWKEVEINGEIKEIPVDWEVDKVRELFDCSMGQTILSKDVAKKKSDNLIPIYSATEDDKYFGFISENKIRNILSKNDIVIPARGNSIGYCKLMKEKSTSTQTTIQLKSKEKISSNFVFYLFKKNKESFFPVNPGAIPQLTVAEVNDLSIVIPRQDECLNITNILSNQSNIIDDKKYILEKEKQKLTFLLNNLLAGNYLVTSDSELL